MDFQVVFVAVLSVMALLEQESSCVFLEDPMNTTCTLGTSFIIRCWTQPGAVSSRWVYNESRVLVTHPPEGLTPTSFNGMFMMELTCTRKRHYTTIQCVAILSINPSREEPSAIATIKVQGMPDRVTSLRNTSYPSVIELTWSVLEPNVTYCVTVEIYSSMRPRELINETCGLHEVYFSWLRDDGKYTTTEDTWYRFRVAASNSVGRGPPSNPLETNFFSEVAYSMPMTETTCAKIFLTEGFSANYNETIAYAIHSMTVQSLQMFNPKATEKNTVPTVNTCHHSDIKVIRYAPSEQLGDDFSTSFMNTFDKILSNVAKDNSSLGSSWSLVQTIAHKFHMMDIWTTIKEVIDSKVMPNLPSDALCDCLLDVDNNGIYQAVAWVSNHYDSGTPITLLNRPIPKMTDASSWQVWKEHLLWYYQDNNLMDAARYLYCATKNFS